MCKDEVCANCGETNVIHWKKDTCEIIQQCAYCQVHTVYRRVREGFELSDYWRSKLLDEGVRQYNPSKILTVEDSELELLIELFSNIPLANVTRYKAEAVSKLCNKIDELKRRV